MYQRLPTRLWVPKQPPDFADGLWESLSRPVKAGESLPRTQFKAYFLAIALHSNFKYVSLSLLIMHKSTTLQLEGSFNWITVPAWEFFFVCCLFICLEGKKNFPPFFGEKLSKTTSGRSKHRKCRISSPPQLQVNASGWTASVKMPTSSPLAHENYK